MGHKHKNHDDNIDVERLIQSFIYLRYQLAKHVVAVFLVEVLSFIVVWLLLLRIEVHVNIIKWIFHVQLLYFTRQVLIRLIEISHKVA